MAYDEERQNPAWAAYRITDQTLSGDFPRPTRFEVDRRTRALVSHDTYTKSGYDRGHMRPLRIGWNKQVVAGPPGGP